jgi:hypothetical protein
MKKADANPQQNIVTDAINAHAEDILTDVRAILKLVRQNNLMEAVDGVVMSTSGGAGKTKGTDALFGRSIRSKKKKCGKKNCKCGDK